MLGAGYFLSRMPSRREPRVMLWAWERPEDLSFLDCRRAGVAVLAETITLGADGMHLAPRRQPIKLPEACPTVAVVRIEAAAGPTSLNLVEPVSSELLRVAARGGIQALQIDFDAVTSQRPFYRALLARVRAGMPEGVELTMTALASWCLFDNWIDGLPVDDAVPMLFQMGVEDRQVRTYLASGGALRSRMCQASLGVSMDERSLMVPKGRQIYVFHAQPWSPDVVSNALGWAEGFR